MSIDFPESRFYNRGISDSEGYHVSKPNFQKVSQIALIRNFLSLTNQSDPDRLDKYSFALEIAVNLPKPKLVKSILELGANKLSWPLTVARNTNQKQNVLLLLQYKADPNTCLNYLFNKEIVNYLVEKNHKRLIDKFDDKNLGTIMSNFKYKRYQIIQIRLKQIFIKDVLNELRKYIQY